MLSVASAVCSHHLARPPSSYVVLGCVEQKETHGNVNGERIMLWGGGKEVWRGWELSTVV